MANETHLPESLKALKRRKPAYKKGSKSNKKQNFFDGVKERSKRMDPKLKKFLRKKARDYNTDDEEEEGDIKEDDSDAKEDENAGKAGGENSDSADTDDENGLIEKKGLGIELDGSGSDDEEEEGGILLGITRFIEGCRAFKIAFKSILKLSVSDEALGPVLSGHKKLVAEKLDEETAERKVKGEARKSKQLVAEKGHVKPQNYLDSNEKFLISVATKGVVKLFNAVNKAQYAQKGLNPSRSKDAKVIKKRRKEAFFSELRKRPGADTSAKVETASGEGPSWAPLRDNYMLTNSKLKNWDKMSAMKITWICMRDPVVADDTRPMNDGSSSEDD